MENNLMQEMSLGEMEEVNGGGPIVAGIIIVGGLVLIGAATYGAGYALARWLG